MQLGPNYLSLCLHCLEATKLKQEAVDVFLRILSSVQPLLNSSLTPLSFSAICNFTDRGLNGGR